MSSRPSRAAASQSTGPHRRRRRSGSTPHDAITADRPPSSPIASLLARRRSRLRRNPSPSRNSAVNVDRRPGHHTIAPSSEPMPQRKAIADATAIPHPEPESHGQIPIAAPAVPQRFRALALFGRRQRQHPHARAIPGVRKPAHERTSLPSACNQKSLCCVESGLDVPPFRGHRRLVSEILRAAERAPNFAQVNVNHRRGKQSQELRK